MDKDELIRGAAHDIANALSAVLGWVELARRGADTHEALSAIEAAARAARTTAQLVLGEEDDTAVADVGMVARNVARLLAPEATRRGTRVHLHGPASAFVGMSPASCFRALWNLALNAVQAARHEVHLEILPDDDETRIAVRDDGTGMDAETRARVLAGGFTTREDGHGIGVGVTRALIEHVGGRLQLDSSEQGTRFTLAVPTAASPRPKSMSGVQLRVRGISVLVVEDDETVRDMIEAVLQLRGAEVVAVESVAAAKAQTERFDVAVVDVTLGDGSGTEVIAWLRQHDLAGRILLASGAADVALESAADGWLRKPFDVQDLVDAVWGDDVADALVVSD